MKTNKPKGKRTIVLSKAKKLTDLKEKPKPAGFEVLTTDGEIKEEKVEIIADDQTSEPLQKKVTTLYILLNIFFHNVTFRNGRYQIYVLNQIY